MQKKLLTLVLLLGVGFLATACVKKETASLKDTAKETPKVQPKDCGTDAACADELVAKCNPGTFSAKQDRITGTVTILEKKGSNCLIKEEVPLTQFSILAVKSYDKNNDGKYELNCETPIFKNYAELATALQGKVATYCKGELLDYTKYLEAEFSK